MRRIAFGALSQVRLFLHRCSGCCLYRRLAPGNHALLRHSLWSDRLLLLANDHSSREAAWCERRIGHDCSADLRYGIGYASLRHDHRTASELPQDKNSLRPASVRTVDLDCVIDTPASGNQKVRTAYYEEHSILDSTDYWRNGNR